MKKKDTNSNIPGADADLLLMSKELEGRLTIDEPITPVPSVTAGRPLKVELTMALTGEQEEPDIVLGDLLYLSLDEPLMIEVAIHPHHVNDMLMSRSPTQFRLAVDGGYSGSLYERSKSEIQWRDGRYVLRVRLGPRG